MRVLVTGAEGLLGHAVVAAARAAGHDAIASSRARCELGDRHAVRTHVDAADPDVVVHAAADVDAAACERDPARAQLANGATTQNVALACAARNRALLYVSANLVFDGRLPHPGEYLELDLPAPVSVYGRSKLAGEELARSLVRRCFVVRTSWLFGRGARPGRRDFVQRVAEADASGAPLSMVSDLFASPTHVGDLARAIVALIETGAWGTYHLVNAGAASPYALAREVLRLRASAASVTETRLADQPPGPVPPAPNTALRNLLAAENLGIALRPWPEAVADYLRTLDD